MALEIIIEKRHVYFLLAFLFLSIGGLVVYAVLPPPNPGHSTSQVRSTFECDAAGDVVQFDVNGDFVCGASGAVTGAGTATHIPVYTGANTIANSGMTESGGVDFVPGKLCIGGGSCAEGSTELDYGAGSTTQFTIQGSSAQTEMQLRETGAGPELISFLQGGVLKAQIFNPAGTSDLTMQSSGAGTVTLKTTGGGNVVFDPGVGTVKVNFGGNTVYRCTVAGTLPIGALTVTPGDCGTAVATKLELD